MFLFEDQKYMMRGSLDTSNFFFPYLLNEFCISVALYAFISERLENFIWWVWLFQSWRSPDVMLNLRHSSWMPPRSTCVPLISRRRIEPDKLKTRYCWPMLISKKNTSTQFFLYFTSEVMKNKSTNMYYAPQFQLGTVFWSLYPGRPLSHPGLDTWRTREDKYIVIRVISTKNGASALGAYDWLSKEYSVLSLLCSNDSTDDAD